MKKLWQKLYDPSNPYLTYGLAIFLPCVVWAPYIYFYPYSGLIDPFLLFFPPIILSTWYGGIKKGVVAIVVDTIIISFVLLPRPLTLFYTETLLIPQIVLLALEGYLTAFAIEFYKDSRREIAYRRREKALQKNILKLMEEKSKAESEVKARDEFLSIASHELRTPLTSMLLQIQRALHNIRNVSLANFSVEKLMNMLTSTEQQTQRLGKMINDLLNVSLITTGKLDLEMQDTDLVMIMKDILKNFSERLKSEGVRAKLKTDAKIPIRCDRLRVEQAINNLISNAIKYGNKKPILIRVFRHNSHGIITIQDMGIGIPKEKLKHVFGRFKRGVSERDYSGLGVGLYITEQIITAHRGKISVTSKEGKGSTFTVQLPLSTARKK